MDDNVIFRKRIIISNLHTYLAIDNPKPEVRFVFDVLLVLVSFTIEEDKYDK